jgi:hypothetical protein
MADWNRTTEQVAHLLRGANPLGASGTLRVNGFTMYQSGVESNNFVTTWVRSPGDTIRTRVDSGTVEVVEWAKAKL